VSPVRPARSNCRSVSAFSADASSVIPRSEATVVQGPLRQY
jgi:hypothetical protein